MSDLNSQKCVPCQIGASKLNETEIGEMLGKINSDWKVITDEGVQKIARKFEFPNFARAKVFVDRVSELAEEEGHHPMIAFTWGWVKIMWWTHKIGGLHKNDFVMAAKVDELDLGS